MPDPTGKYIAEKILANGVIPLVNFTGDKLVFITCGTDLPPLLLDYLGAQNGRRGRILRNYLVNVARGIIIDQGEGDIISARPARRP